MYVTAMMSNILLLPQISDTHIYMYIMNNNTHCLSTIILYTHTTYPGYVFIRTSVMHTIVPQAFMPSGLDMHSLILTLGIHIIASNHDYYSPCIPHIFISSYLACSNSRDILLRRTPSYPSYRTNSHPSYPLVPPRTLHTPSYLPRTLHTPSHPSYPLVPLRTLHTQIWSQVCLGYPLPSTTHTPSSYSLLSSPTPDISLLPRIFLSYPGYFSLTPDISLLPRIFLSYPGYFSPTPDISLVPRIFLSYPGYFSLTPDISLVPRIFLSYPGYFSPTPDISLLPRIFL